MLLASIKFLNIFLTSIKEPKFIVCLSTWHFRVQDVAFQCMRHMCKCVNIFSIHILFYCLAVIFVKINYVFMCLFVAYVQKPSTLILLAFLEPLCVLITSYVWNTPVLFSIWLFYMFKMLLDFCAVCQTYKINKVLCWFSNHFCYFNK